MVKNALVAIENIQKPPYIDTNQTRFPQQANDKDYDGTDINVSFSTFARRTSNLLPTNELHFSIGFCVIINGYINGKWMQQKDF